MKFFTLFAAIAVSSWAACTDPLSRLSANASSRLGGWVDYNDAIDGNASTSWLSDNDTQQWFTIDLGSVQSVAGVNLNWGSGFPSSYDIRYSTDGSNFFTAHSLNSGSTGSVEHSFTPVNARYIGMDLNARSSSSTVNYYELREYEVFANCGGSSSGALEVPQIIPLPAQVTLNGGATWGASDGVTLASDDFSQSWSSLLNDIRTEAGMSSSGIPLTLSLNTSLSSTLGDEGYQLNADGDGIEIIAADEVGVFYGLQSLRQIWLSGEDHEGMDIVDVPANDWRGLMLDPARNFIPIEFLERTIDHMAILKLNRLHLHLTDDQGWRIEIKAYPKLHTEGSQSSTLGNSGYYTQDQFKALIQYASDRNVIIVPEIDLPGHTHAIKATYPEYGCGSDYGWPYTGVEVGFSKLCLTHPEIQTFVSAILDEVIAMTPGPWIHIGGDEIEDSGYSSFITWLDTYVSSQSKVMVGWQEIKSGSLSANTIYQQWQQVGSTSGPQPWVNSTCTYAYLDHPETPGGDGLTWCTSAVTAQSVYDLPSGNTGVEVAVWGELMSDTSVISDRLYPRLYSASEAGWTPSARQSWSDFQSRLSRLETYLQGDVDDGVVSLKAQVQTRLRSLEGSTYYDLGGRRLESQPLRGRYLKRNGQGQFQVIVQP